MQKGTIADRLAKLVEVAGSQQAFATLVGKTRPAVHGWLNGATPYPSTLVTIAKKTGVSLEWLRDGDGYEPTELEAFRQVIREGGRRQFVGQLSEDPAEYKAVATTGGLNRRKIPVICLAQAGDPVEWADVDDYEGIDAVGVKDPQAVAVRIRGDSMAPDYKEGTIAIVYPNTPPRSDNLVIARFTDGNVVFKRLHMAGDQLHFLSINPKYDTIVKNPGQVERLLTVGQTFRYEL